MTVWSQSPRGRAIDLLEPRVDQVDFREIADALAGINRYAGAVDSMTAQVSVAMHTLIVIDAAPDFAKPWAALHDASKARFGEQIRPFLEALRSELNDRLGRDVQSVVTNCLYDLHYRHFYTICEAAGLDVPDSDILSAIERADRVALATERRFFLAKCEQPWRPSLECVDPLPRRPRWLPADKAADALFERFEQLLPALRHAAA